MKHMIRCYHFLAAMCLNVCLCAQPFGEASADFRIKKLEYENASGEKATTWLKYDHEGILSKAFWILDDESRNSMNFYEYDAHGWLISAYREFSDGLTSFELFTYDSLGKKISEYFYRSDSVSGHATYIYEDNNVIKADFRNHKGWLNGTLIYRYDDKMRKKEAVLLRDNKIYSRISYEYDENHNLRKEFWDFNGTWNQTFIYHYERKDIKVNYYSSPFLTNKTVYRICKENYSFNNEIGGPSFYYYDSEGLLNKKVFVRSDSISTTTCYEYDQERRLVRSKRDYSDGSVALFSYMYDEDGNMILRSCFKEDTLIGFESYLYNSEGDLIKAYLKNFDSWITGTINFELNQLGIITGGQFQGENGFNASIVFNYNDEGLIAEIIWKFTFGKFQQYVFEYEFPVLPS